MIFLEAVGRKGYVQWPDKTTVLWVLLSTWGPLFTSSHSHPAAGTSLMLHQHGRDRKQRLLKKTCFSHRDQVILTKLFSLVLPVCSFPIDSLHFTEGLIWFWGRLYSTCVFSECRVGRVGFIYKVWNIQMLSPIKAQSWGSQDDVRNQSQ